jgi:hypothetical protein
MLQLLFGAALAGNIVGFYHTAIIDHRAHDRWQYVINEQMSTISASPLFAATTHLWVSAIGDCDDRGAYQRELNALLALDERETSDWLPSALFLAQAHSTGSAASALFPALTATIQAMEAHQHERSGRKVLLGAQSPMPHLGEYPTLWLLYSHCHAQPDDVVWYVHSKGMRHQHCWALEGTDCSDDWRRVMTFFIVNRGLEWCVERLRRGEIDVCAPNWLPNAEHASGNFWLTSCRWVLRRERPFPKPGDSHDDLHRLWPIEYLIDGSTLMTEHDFEGERMDAELWIGTHIFGEHARGHCMHRSQIVVNGSVVDVNHYVNEYPPALYINSTDGQGCEVVAPQ